MFTSKSFSVTPSIFASRGAPSRLQSTAEGVACATQRATWRGWRLRGPTATLARALGGQWQMPWFQGYTWNILQWNSANWLTKNDSERTMYLTKQLKEKETSDECHTWCWHCCLTAGIGPLFYKSNDHKTDQRSTNCLTLPLCQPQNSKKQKKLLNCPCNVWLATFIFFNICTRFPNQPHFRRGRLRIFNWKKLQITPLRRIGWDLSNWKEHQCRRWGQIWSGLWIVCWSIKGVEMYWVISFNMATWEDLWYFTAS